MLTIFKQKQLFHLRGLVAPPKIPTHPGTCRVRPVLIKLHLGVERGDGGDEESDDGGGDDEEGDDGGGDGDGDEEGDGDGGGGDCDDGSDGGGGDGDE